MISISSFINFLIIINILHNYILYVFLFFSFYHKLIFIHNFIDIFLLRTFKSSISETWRVINKFVITRASERGGSLLD